MLENFRAKVLKDLRRECRPYRRKSNVKIAVSMQDGAAAKRSLIV